VLMRWQLCGFHLPLSKHGQGECSCGHQAECSAIIELSCVRIDARSASTVRRVQSATLHGVCIATASACNLYYRHIMLAGWLLHGHVP
jgi:hypothetical protein